MNVPAETHCSTQDDDEALEQFEREDPQAARLVKLRYYAGLSIEEAAEHAGFSRSTAYEHWAYARAWLHRRMGSAPELAGP
jgi:DNA-directed RNA polymerase specialized sigma24 family protein